MWYLAYLSQLDDDDESLTAEGNRRRREKYSSLTDKEREERIRSIPRGSLPPPGKAPWDEAYRSGRDCTLITLVGLNFEAFSRLHAGFHQITTRSIGCTATTERNS